MTCHWDNLYQKVYNLSTSNEIKPYSYTKKHNRKMVPRHFTTLCVEGLNWRMGEQESLCSGGKAHEQISIPLYLIEHNFTENSRKKTQLAVTTREWKAGNKKRGQRLLIKTHFQWPLNDLQETWPEVVV